MLIILVIGSCVIFGGFPSKFSKCCFHSFILSCWFNALSFALAVFFLLLTSFIVCQAILDCLSSTESLILSILFWMYSVCSFIYMPARSHKKNSTRFSEKLKIGKLQGWTKFPRKYGRPDNSTTYCSDTATQYTIKIR